MPLHLTSRPHLCPTSRPHLWVYIVLTSFGLAVSAFLLLVRATVGALPPSRVGEALALQTLASGRSEPQWVKL